MPALSLALSPLPNKTENFRTFFSRSRSRSRRRKRKKKKKKRKKKSGRKKSADFDRCERRPVVDCVRGAKQRERERGREGERESGPLCRRRDYFVTRRRTCAPCDAKHKLTRTRRRTRRTICLRATSLTLAFTHNTISAAAMKGLLTGSLTLKRRLRLLLRLLQQQQQQ